MDEPGQLDLARVQHAGDRAVPQGVPGRRGHVFQKKLFDNGLNLKTTGDTAIVAPPFISTRTDVDAMTDILRQTLTEL